MTEGIVPGVDREHQESVVIGLPVKERRTGVLHRPLGVLSGPLRIGLALIVEA
jgi:hypothetical protein